MEEAQDDSRFDMLSAVQLNRQKLELRFEAAQKGGHRWLAECRDMWDAYDRDAGVYFVECRDDAAVGEVFARCSDDVPDDRLLGIFDLQKPLCDQKGGMTKAEWLDRQG